jgi:hypothetical protein
VTALGPKRHEQTFREHSPPLIADSQHPGRRKA